MSVLPAPQLQELLDKSPSNWRVTDEAMGRRINRVDYHLLPGTTVTICNIMLDNGFSVRGEAACVDRSNYNADVGQTISYNNAFAKLWPLFGFLLAETRYRALVDDRTSLVEDDED